MVEERVGLGGWLAARPKRADPRHHEIAKVGTVEASLLQLADDLGHAIVDGQQAIGAISADFEGALDAFVQEGVALLEG